MSTHITRYDVMPIPPVDAQTEYFESGALRIGVEYRLLDDAIAAANESVPAVGGDAFDGGVGEDCGVSLHVFAKIGERWLEFLRFDCFREDPHYHYVSWSAHSNEMIHIDPVAEGDTVAWALERIRTRLPQMLERAGAAAAARAVTPHDIETLLPRITEAAFRMRYHHDADAVRSAALGSSSA